MNIQQICNNNSDLLLMLISLVSLVIGIIALFLLYREIRKLNTNESIGEPQPGLSTRYIGDDGEFEDIDHDEEIGQKERKQKKNRALRIGFRQLAIVFLELAIALIGLVTAIISFLSAFQPSVTVKVTSICLIIFDGNNTPTPVFTLTPTIEQTPTPLATYTSTPEPSPSYTPLPPLTLTATLFTLTPTIEQTATPLATYTLTPTPSPRFYPLTLTDSLNVWPSYLGLSRGQIPLQGIPFNIGNELNTLGCRRGINATVVSTTANVDKPYSVYLLANTGNGFMWHNGKNIGQVNLIFDNGKFSYNLKLGENIRDWATSPASTAVTIVTSSETKEVHTGTAYDGSIGRIDLITISIPLDYRNQFLYSIEIVDTSGGSLSSGDDPCIQVQAITVEVSP